MDFTKKLLLSNVFRIIIFLLFVHNVNYAQIDPSFKPKETYSSILKKYEGKVIYVDFWASWCAPCRKEIKKMKEIKKEYPPEDVIFLYITMDLNKEDCEKAIKKDGIIESDRNYYIIEIEKDELFKKIKLKNEIPFYLIYNKKGELVNSDAPRPSEREKLYKEINKYLAE